MSNPDRLIAGQLLTGATREVLAARVARARLPYTPAHFSAREFALLEELSLLLVPHDPAIVPLARSVDARLTRGDGDGWRYDELPPDAVAYRMLLLALPDGGNCQLFAYEVLAHFGFQIPDVRSAELWRDTDATSVVLTPQPLDLVLLHDREQAWGAHVGVVVSDTEVLHLCVDY